MINPQSFRRCLQGAGRLSTSSFNIATHYRILKPDVSTPCPSSAARLRIVSWRHFSASTIHKPGVRSRAHPDAKSRTRTVLAVLAACASTITATALFKATPTFAEEPNKQKYIRLSDVHKHNSSSESYWVYRGNRVYDITDWVPNHPGGEVILRAVGGNIEPYWNIFTIHQKQDVYDILEQYFIGLIDPQDLVDGKAPVDQIDDPFKQDPQRDEELLVQNLRPFNAETPPSDLESFITPIGKFYVRNHLWVPGADATGAKLTVEMQDGETKEYSVDDLRNKFKEYTITATMQCSGNRRSHMTQGSSPTNGIQWDIGAISNAEWTGVRLVDLLKDAGLDPLDIPDDVKHVQFEGAEAYGASVPIEKAIDQFGDALIVYAMNGEPLSRDHGAPLRALVPGTVAARSVKWLQKILLSEEESNSQWQRRDYKCFGPNEGGDPDWDSAVAIQEVPVQSAITSAHKVTKNRLDNSKLARVYGLEEESVILRGYALSGGGRRIVRVDVSPDNGKTWQQAEFHHAEEKGHRSWSWRQWSLAVPTRLLSNNVCVKATDDGYNTQPENFPPYYNFRGNLANSWHRVPVADVLNSRITAKK